MAAIFGNAVAFHENQILKIIRDVNELVAVGAVKLNHQISLIGRSTTS